MMEKIIKIFGKKTVKLAAVILLAAALLGGCVPTYYSKSQEEVLIKACTPAIEKFLADRYGEYKLGEFHLLKGLTAPEKPLEGNFASNIVRGSYTVQENTWDLVYDSESGEFYTNELAEKLMEQEQARILEYLLAELPEEELMDFRLTVLDFYYLVQSHDVKINSEGNTADTYVYINNVLPAGITEEDLPAFAERGFDGGTVNSIRCHYYSGRANALTEAAFERFFADNPAYQVGQYLLIDNDNPSAKEESSGENTQEETLTWFKPEPVGEDADCSIEFENGSALARRPHFTESDGVITMQFNGTDRYCVRVIRREDMEKYFPDDNLLVKSSNLKIFKSYENQRFAYSCLFIPSDSSNSVFLFETDSEPEAADFGWGFTDEIHYYTAGEEVFPDTEL